MQFKGNPLTLRFLCRDDMLEELAALCLESGLRFAYRRVAVEGTLPYARHLELAALPSVEGIVAAARRAMRGEA